MIENHMVLPSAWAGLAREVDPVAVDDVHESIVSGYSDEMSNAIRAGNWHASIASSTFSGLPMVESASAAWDAAMKEIDYEVVELLISAAMSSTDAHVRTMARALVAKVAGQHAEHIAELRGL